MAQQVEHPDSLDRVIQAHCLRVLQRRRGSVEKASRDLGVGRATLYRWLARWTAELPVYDLPDNPRDAVGALQRRLLSREGRDVAGQVLGTVFDHLLEHVGVWESGGICTAEEWLRRCHLGVPELRDCLVSLARDFGYSAEDLGLDARQAATLGFGPPREEPTP